jgi:hypothetical protein
MKGVLLGWFNWLVLRVQVISVLPRLLFSQPSTQYFFSPHAIAQQPGLAVVLGRLSLCLWLTPFDWSGPSSCRDPVYE